MRSLRLMAAALLATLSLVPAAAGAAPQAAPALTAPPLAGPYAVGRTNWQWSDQTGPHYALVFYPSTGTPPVPSSPSGNTAPQQLATRYGSGAVPQLAALQVRSAPSLPPAPAAAQAARPVLIFASGANQKAGDYTVLLEQVASRGYTIVALDAPPAGGDAYDATASAIGAALRETERQHAKGFLAGRLDGPAAAFGHSIGGAGAVLALTRYPALRAAFNLDGDFTGAAASARPSAPVAMIESEPPARGGWLAGLAERRSLARRADAWAQLRATSRAAVLVRARGMYHANFLDAALVPPAAMDPAKRAERFGSIDGARGLLLSADLVASFFSGLVDKTPAANAADRSPAAAVRAAAARYPELSLP